MTDLEIYEEAVRLLRSGTPFSLATVTACGGSSPRKAGARMLVYGDGATLGSVGGGRVEQETVAAAQAALRDGSPRTLPFRLTEENGFACGGSMEVYVEPHGGMPRLVMFGAGHVGKAVSALAATCGFRVTVVDERPECTGRDQFPFAHEIVCATVADAFPRLSVDRDTSVVIATPGHLHDFEAVRGALKTDARFIGLVGSRRKRELLLTTLEGEGVGALQCERIVTPVGLDIGAETPEEIAVSIVGQLIRERRMHGAHHGDPAGGRPVEADGELQAAPPP